jgi:uncharacterized protein YlaI
MIDPMPANTKLKPCRLCKKDAELRKSHIVPQFVFKWLKQTSPGAIRNTSQINRRVQDGPTQEWLCDDCEQRLSGWERQFAQNVFQYVHTTSEEQKLVPYADWALKFATSISWRVLQFHRDSKLNELSEKDIHAIDKAERVWREFLLGERLNPSEFEQHVFLVDALATASGPVSPFLSRYLLRSIHTDFILTDDECITFAKLGRIIIFGFIRVQASRRWKGTKLHVKAGTIGWNCKLPSTVFGYLNIQANHAGRTLASMSERQVSIIDQAVANTDVDMLVQSEVFRAIEADLAVSGNEAFAITQRKVKTSNETG